MDPQRDQAAGSTFFETLEPRLLLDAFVVNSLADSGEGSLRSAIASANAHLGPDIIEFQVAGTIAVSTQLPELSDSSGGTTIDGTGAPGYAGAPVVALQGPGTGSFSGLKITSADNEVRALQIGSFRYGIHIDGAPASNNAVAGCYLGTDGAVAVPNGSGVWIWGAPDNRIGTDGDGAGDAEERNVISGNSASGVEVSLNGATGNLIKGNFIGTNAEGTGALGNGSGVRIASAIGTIIGGTTPSERNVISGSSADGVAILGGSAAGNVVQGNFIGTDVTGTGSLGNFTGVWIYSASNNTIGGTVTGARNIISGNRKHGVNIGDSRAAGNLVQGNFIGTDVNGTADLGNTSDGVQIHVAANNTIGGVVAGAGNVISGNNGRGVHIRDSGAPGNLIQGNFIGTDVNGTAALGNSVDGILISNSSFNTVGGTGDGAGNIIAFNAAAFGDGVSVTGGAGNAILGNSILANSGLGIDLLPDGVTPNDSGDGDTGANDLQNFPVLTSAASDSASTTIEGTLSSTPSSSRMSTEILRDWARARVSWVESRLRPTAPATQASPPAFRAPFL